MEHARKLQRKSKEKARTKEQEKVKGKEQIQEILKEKATAIKLVPTNPMRPATEATEEFAMCMRETADAVMEISHMSTCRKNR